MVRKMPFLLLTLILLPVCGNAESGRFGASPKFQAASQALDAANLLPPRERVRAQFVCEFADGAPAPAAYRVVTDRYTGVGLRSDEKWQARDGFPGLEEAVEFANKEGAGPARFVACWNPSRFPSGTMFTVFYLASEHADAFVTRYRLIDGEFPDAAAATAYANGHLDGDELASAQFISEFSAARQTASSWRIVTVAREEEADGNAAGDSGNGNKRAWRAVENDQKNLSLRMETALDAANEDSLAGHKIRFAATVSSADISSRIVLFEIAAPDGPPQTVFSLPAAVFATGDLIRKTGLAKIGEIVSTALSAFYRQTSIRIEVNGGIREIDEVPSADPIAQAKALPRGKNSLNIFLSDMPASETTADGNAATLDGYAGRSWVFIWVPDSYFVDVPSPENVLVHELGHEFGARHSDNPDSVMCSLSQTPGCTLTRREFDGRDLLAIRQGVKAIGRIGFDTYTGLVSGYR